MPPAESHMKKPLTIRLERPAALALARLAQERKVSQASLANEAIDAYLTGQELVSLARLAEELRSAVAEQATAQRSALAEQRQLFEASQRANVEQVTKVLEALQRVVQPLVEAITGRAGGGGGPPPTRPGTPDIVIGNKSVRP